MQTKLINTKTFPALLTSLLTFTALTTLNSLASTASATDFLTPYSATYTATHSSVPISGQASRSLTKNEDGSYQLKQTASVLVANISETSHFIHTKNKIQPSTYSYLRSSFGKKKSTQMAFDWNAKQVTGTHKEEAFRLSLDENRQDPLSYQIALRQALNDVLTGKLKGDRITITLVDKDELETQTYALLGTEKVTTPAGEFDSLKVKRIRKDGKRETTIWFAKDQNLLITKLEQKEKDGKRYELSLKEFSFSP